MSSPLFFKVSWQADIDRFRHLQKRAKKQRLSLQVHNVSRTRGLPAFMFRVKDPRLGNVQELASLDDVERHLRSLIIDAIRAGDAALHRLRMKPKGEWDSERAEAIREAAKWLTVTPHHMKPHPIVPEIQKRFGLSKRESCLAISEACLMRGRAGA